MYFGCFFHCIYYYQLARIDVQQSKQKCNNAREVYEHSTISHLTHITKSKDWDGLFGYSEQNDQIDQT